MKHWKGAPPVGLKDTASEFYICKEMNSANNHISSEDDVDP